MRQSALRVSSGCSVLSTASSLTSLSPLQDELLPAVLPPPSAELDETAACQDAHGLTFTAPQALVDPSYSHPLRIFVSPPTHPSACRVFQDALLSCRTDSLVLPMNNVEALCRIITARKIGRAHV